MKYVHMKPPKKLAAAAALFLILYSIPAFTLKADGLPEETTERSTMAEEPSFVPGIPVKRNFYGISP